VLDQILLWEPAHHLYVRVVVKHSEERLRIVLLVLLSHGYDETVFSVLDYEVVYLF
jgi:hypothetical protein